MDEKNYSNHAICQKDTRCVPNRELTRMSEDDCYLYTRNRQSQKPLKWHTYHWRPYGCDVIAPSYLLHAYKDGFGPGSCNIDADSSLKICDSNRLTNRNFPQELSTLPVHMPRIRGCFDPDTESDLRWRQTRAKDKPCNQHMEESHIPLRWNYFKHLCYNPQETQFIIPEDTFKYAFNLGDEYAYYGTDTRHAFQDRYRATDCVDDKIDQYYRFQQPGFKYSEYGY